MNPSSLLMEVGAIAMVIFARWLVRRKKEGKPTLLDPDLFKSKYFRLGITEQMLQNIARRNDDRPTDLFSNGVRIYCHANRYFDCAIIAQHFFCRILAGRRGGKRRASRIIEAGFGLLALGILPVIFFIPRVDSGWYFAIPLVIAGTGLGLLVSQITIPSLQFHKNGSAKPPGSTLPGDRSGYRLAWLSPAP